MTFHPLAKNVLRNHLDKILSGIALDTDRKFLFEHYDFDAMTHLVREILKTKGDYLRERDIFEIILGNIFREVRRVENQFPPTAPIIFRNLLGEELSNALIDKIIKFFESVPRDYFIKFPLSVLPEIGEKEFFLTKQISIVQTPDEPPKSLGTLAEDIAKARLGGLLDFGEKPPTKKYLRIKSKGYVSPSMSDIAIVNALSIFKQILYLGIAEKIFLIGNEAALFRLFGYSQDCLDPTIKEKFELPSNIARMLGNLKIQNFGGAETSSNKSVKDTTIEKIKDIFTKYEKFSLFRI